MARKSDNNFKREVAGYIEKATAFFASQNDRHCVNSGDEERLLDWISCRVMGISAHNR
jgi:hypothetical protein